MLERRFPRPVGDIGTRDVAFPVRSDVRCVAAPSSSSAIVLAAPFVAAARLARDEGVDAIATSCGFLALFQREMAAALAGAGVDLEPAARRR